MPFSSWFRQPLSARKAYLLYKSLMIRHIFFLALVKSVSFTLAKDRLMTG